jgi:putative hydroxymethylpyrimidine transport system substrate-binding protein
MRRKSVNSSPRCRKGRYLRAHPQESWQAFAAAHPELKTELNQQAWLQTVPFATDPAALDKARYELMNSFYITISW